MTELYFPVLLDPTSTRFDIIDSAARFASPITGYTRTVARTGERVRLTLNFANLNGQRRAAMQSFLAGMRGAVHRAWCKDHSYTRRGSFSASELLSNATFANGTTGWSTAGETALTAADRALRASRTAATAVQAAVQSASVSVTSTDAYVFRAIILPGRGGYASGFRLDVGTTAGASNIASSTVSTAYGLHSVAFVPGGSTAYVTISDLTTSPAVGDYFIVPWMSLSRCARANGASQTGSGLNVKNLPISTDGLLLPGDQIQVGGELKLVTQAVNSDSSGNGHIRFEPALRSSPADNAPVVIHEPMGKFFLENNENGWGSVAGVFSDTEITLIEAA